VRIVAGAARGRRLASPPDDVRPTADRVREALFASLGPTLAGASVLDAFAGSGALGLEALSRGAAAVTLVERDRRALDALRDNIARVGLAGATVVAADVLRLLGDAAWRGAPPPGAPYDLVLLDPPYATDEEALAGLLADLVPQLAPGARIVVERPADAPAPSWPAALRPDEPRRYGSTRLHRAAHVAAGTTEGP
jgi:16S rRNA (guanine966-N2)-methyltransferase